MTLTLYSTYRNSFKVDCREFWSLKREQHVLKGWSGHLQFFEQWCQITKQVMLTLLIPCYSCFNRECYTTCHALSDNPRPFTDKPHLHVRRGPKCVKKCLEHIINVVKSIYISFLAQIAPEFWYNCISKSAAMCLTAIALHNTQHCISRCRHLIGSKRVKVSKF